MQLTASYNNTLCMIALAVMQIKADNTGRQKDKVLSVGIYI